MNEHSHKVISRKRVFIKYHITLHIIYFNGLTFLYKSLGLKFLFKDNCSNSVKTEEQHKLIRENLSTQPGVSAFSEILYRAS